MSASCPHSAPLPSTPSRLPLPPRVTSSLPVVGPMLAMATDPEGFLTDAYAKYGPVFRARLARMDYTILAGPEARDFFLETKERYFSREAFFRAFMRELGAKYFVLAAPSDTGDQGKLRKMMRVGFSREVATAYVPELIESVRSEVSGWHPGQSIRVMDVMARVTFRQYGFVMCDRDLGSVFRDAYTYAKTMMDVGAWVAPEAVFLRPAYVRAKARIFALMKELVADARRRQTERPTRMTALDALLRATDAQGRPIDEDILVSTALYGFVGTIVYMNRAISFLLYELAKNPDALERVTAEADVAFANGEPDGDALRRMDYLRAAFAESLRRHPIAIGLPFRVEEEFEFAGCRVEKGAFVLVSTVPSHFSPEHYRDPWRFDAERCMAHRNEHKTPGAYTPWGMGGRVCSAVGLVETMSLAAVATIAHAVRFELTKPSYRLRTLMNPLPGPADWFTLRIAERRAPRLGVVAPAARDEDAVVATAEAAGVGALLGTMKVQSFAPHTVILREGDRADAFYILVEGSVEVIKHGADGAEIPITRLGAGQHFGEIGLLMGGVRTATVRCLDRPARAIVLSSEEFERIIAEADLPSSDIAIVARRRFMTSRLAEALPRLGAALVQKFGAELEMTTYAAGQEIVREGDVAETFHVVARGRVEVVQETPHGPMVRAELGPGEYFGEMGLLMRRPRIATVRAAEGGADVMTMQRDGFVRMMSNSTGTSESVADLVMRRLEQLGGSQSPSAAPAGGAPS